MASNKDINIRINAKDRASGVFAKVGRGLGGFERRLSNIGFSLASLPAALGATGLLAFGAKAVAAAAEQEKAERSLAAALKLVGDGRRESLDDLKQYASGLQQITTYGDEALLQLMSLGATSGQLAGRDLKRATVAAIGLSKAFGIDTVAAMRLVARAAVGDTAQLKRYGIIIEQTLSTQEKFNALLKIGERNFSLATDEVNTLAGGIQQLKNALGDTMEILGGAAPGGENNWFAQQAQGVSALNAALQDTDSELNSVLQKIGKVFARNANVVTMGAFSAAGGIGDLIGTKLTEDQLNLKPSQEAIDAWKGLSLAQRQAIAVGRQLTGELTLRASDRLRIEREIASVIEGPQKQALDEQIKQLRDAEQKERERLDTLDRIRDRYDDLASQIARANAEQAKQIQQQLDGLRELYREKANSNLFDEFSGNDSTGRSLAAEAARQQMDLASTGDAAAELRAAMANFDNSLQSRIDSLERTAVSADATDAERRDAGALAATLRGMEDMLRNQARSDVLRNQEDTIKRFIQTPMEAAIESIGRSAEEARRIIQGQLEAGVLSAEQAANQIAKVEQTREQRIVEARKSQEAAARSLPDLISGRLLTGMTAAFRSGQERSNPNKGVEDRLEKGNRTQAMMLKRMEDMLLVLRSGRNPIAGIGSI